MRKVLAMLKNNRVKRIAECLVLILVSCVVLGCAQGSSETNSETVPMTSIPAEEISEPEAVREPMTQEELWEVWGIEIPGTEIPVFEISEEEKEFYKNWLEANAVDFVQKVEETEYGYYDVNYDGVAELIVREPMHTYVFQRQNEEVFLLSEESQYMHLLPNGMLMRFEVAPDCHEYSFYLLEEDGYQLCRTMSRRDTAEGGYGKFDAKDDEILIEDTLVTNEEWQRLLYDILLPYRGYDENNTEEYYWGYEYYLAEIEYSKLADKQFKELTYTTEEDAYQAFLDGECGAYISDTYSDEHVGYMTFRPETARSYYLYDIVNLLLNDGWKGSTEVTFEQYDGYDIRWAYIDCGVDGKKELLLEINKDSNSAVTYYVLQYREGQLYLCYAIDKGERSFLTVADCGYLQYAGSGGAYSHSGYNIVLDNDGSPHLIDKWYSEIRGNFLYIEDDETDNLVNDILIEYSEEHEMNDDLYGFELACYFIGGEYYYLYYFDEEDEVQVDLAKTLEESEIDFATTEEIEELISEEKAKWGILESTEETEVRLETFKQYEYFK